MKQTRIYDAGKAFAGVQGDLSNAQLAFGLGHNTLGLDLDIENAIMDGDSVRFINEDLTITVTSEKQGAIGRLFYDLFENPDEKSSIEDI
jgi:hypothetical protein